MPTIQESPSATTDRLRSFAERHPLLVLMLVFNTFGQALVLGPTVLMGDDAPNLEVLQSISLIAFLLLPALVLVRVSRGPEALLSLGRAVVTFRVHPGWYLLPFVAVPAGILLVNAALPHEQTIDARSIATAYVTGFLPALAVQFLTTNWWEETVWTGVVQSPLQERFGPIRGVLLTAPLFLLEHVFLALGGTLREGITLLAILLPAVVFVRMTFGWVYQRTGSLALAGLVHASSNAAALGLAARLYTGDPDSVVTLALIGLVVLVATRGRLGWPRRRTPASSSSTVLPPPPGSP